MKCITRHDLIEFLVNDFQSEQQKSEVRRHLDGCGDCRELAGKLDKEIEEVTHEARRECEAVQDHLPNHLVHQTATVAGININEHLSQCDTCSFIYRQARKEHSFEEANALDYPVPKSLVQKLDQLIEDALGKLHPRPGGEPIIHKLRKLVDCLVLTLEPQPAVQFLGAHLTGAARIEIPARDLKVNVGAPCRVVKIFSMNNDELDRQVSNQQGVVQFEDFEPGTYQLTVEGFEIKRVQQDST